MWLSEQRGNTVYLSRAAGPLTPRQRSYLIWYADECRNDFAPQRLYRAIVRRYGDTPQSAYLQAVLALLTEQMSA